MLTESDKERALAEAVVSVQTAATCNQVYILRAEELLGIPGAPFAYWTSRSIRALFHELPSFEGSGRYVRQGLATADDYRFIRTAWEVNPEDIGHSWRRMTKGGAFSRYYADVNILVNWKNEGDELSSFSNSVIRNPDFYFRPGISWPLRGVTFSAQAVPRGCIFSVAGKLATTDSEAELSPALAIFNSRCFDYLVRLFAGKVGGVQYEVGLIGSIPYPAISDATRTNLAHLVSNGWSLERALDETNPVSSVFRGPGLILFKGTTLVQAYNKWMSSVQQSLVIRDKVEGEIDKIVLELYGIHDSDITSSRTNHIAQSYDDTEVGEVTAIEQGDTLYSAVSALFDYAIGCVYGRWDIGTGSAKSIVTTCEPAEMFAELPVCSPCTLRVMRDLAATASDKFVDYPIQISWPGILVTDPGHTEDICSRIREVLAIFWPESDDAIEQEALDVLNMDSLYEYLSNPALFFEYHLTHYSKSRRTAPIYWPLSTASGSYTLWLYYHRLTDQTLYKCVNDFVDSKRKQVTEQFVALQRKPNRSPNEERTLEQLAGSERELSDFRAELLRVAAFWKPNLNDGVQITAAPLYRLFGHRAWRRSLQETWEKLEAGEYDWAHLAYSIWPERVQEKCRTDKSLAIAHDLEHLYVAPPVPAKSKGKRGKSKPAADVDAGEDAAQAAMELGDVD
jgi:hypothetical protein